MDLRKSIAGAFTALAVASMVNCSGGGPTTPPDPPSPTPDLVVSFPGMTMHGDTLFMVEGDTLSCSGKLVPESETLSVGWRFNDAPAFCVEDPIFNGYQKLWYTASGSVITPQTGEYILRVRIQSPSGTTVSAKFFTVVVMPRSEGQLAMIGLLPRNRDETYP